MRIDIDNGILLELADFDKIDDNTYHYHFGGDCFDCSLYVTRGCHCFDMERCTFTYEWTVEYITDFYHDRNNNGHTDEIKSTDDFGLLQTIKSFVSIKKIDLILGK